MLLLEEYRWWRTPCSFTIPLSEKQTLKAISEICNLQNYCNWCGCSIERCRSSGASDRKYFCFKNSVLVWLGVQLVAVQHHQACAGPSCAAGWACRLLFDKQIDSIIGIKYQLDWAFVQSQPFWRRQVLLAVVLSVILQLPESTQQLQPGRDPVLRWCTLFLLLRMLNSLSTLQSAKTTQTSHTATPLSNN